MIMREISDLLRIYTSELRAILLGSLEELLEIQYNL